MSDPVRHKPFRPAAKPATPSPTTEHFEASKEILSRLPRMLTDADALFAFERRILSFVRAQPAESMPGLAALLDETLPREDDEQRKVARALKCELRTLKLLRRGRLDPATADDPTVVARLGRIAGLSRDAFLLLCQRDHDRLVSTQQLNGARARSARNTPFEALRAAWDRDAEDDPVER